MRDKVRDSLYGGEAKERRNEEAALKFTNFTDKLERPYAAGTTLLVCLALELAVILVQVFAPWVAWSIFDLIGAMFRYVAIGIFGLGYLIAFSGLRYIRSARAPRLTDSPIEDGVMSAFYYEEKQQRRKVDFFICAAAGLGNVVAMLIIRAVAA